MKLNSCYYGERRVIYIRIGYPDHKNGQKLVSVYGHTLDQVIRVVDKGVTEAFGKVGANRPKGRPANKKRRS